MGQTLNLKIVGQMCWRESTWGDEKVNCLWLRQLLAVNRPLACPLFVSKASRRRLEDNLASIWESSGKQEWLEMRIWIKGRNEKIIKIACFYSWTYIYIYVFIIVLLYMYITHRHPLIPYKRHLGRTFSQQSKSKHFDRLGAVWRPLAWLQRDSHCLRDSPNDWTL